MARMVGAPQVVPHAGRGGMHGSCSGTPSPPVVGGDDVDAKGVDPPVALVAGVAPDVGAAVVHGLVRQGYEVWASETCLASAGWVLPRSRVHPLTADLDTQDGCDDVLAAVCATRRPVIAAVVSLEETSSARLHLVDTLQRFMSAWGAGRLVLVADVHEPALINNDVLGPARRDPQQQARSSTGRATVTTVISPVAARRDALTTVLGDGARPRRRHRWRSWLLALLRRTAHAGPT